jgi:hypothetical protein
MHKNLNEEQIGIMPANGVAFSPPGRPTVTPSPVVTANNLLKAQVPTTVAAMAGAIAPQAPVTDEESEDQNEESEESEKEEMEEDISGQFRNALANLLGENVSETSIDQLEAIFESAVEQKSNFRINKVVNQLDSGVQNYLNEVTNTLVEKVDDYLDYVVEEWMQENTIAVEQGIKTQIAENFINGLKNLFENHYIDVPSDKYNALDELYAQTRELEGTLNNAIHENMNLKKELMLNECATIFVAETRDLADTQISKLQSLMENVSFESPEEYKNKLYAIKDNYLTTVSQPVQYSRPVPQQINEDMTFSAVKAPESSTVEGYANVIGKLNKKL